MENFQQTSHYGEKFDIQFIKYMGNDYSKVAFIFPGQGSSSPGMFKNELKKLPICLERFTQADKWAESKNIGKISWFIWAPHLIEKNNFSIIQNLALYTLEVGLFESLLSMNKFPEVVTAHSFGEYAALVSVGAVNFLDMLEIVFQRERLSPPLNTIGSMLALSCSRQFFENLSCPVKCTLANENSHQQIVLSFDLSYKNELMHFLKSQRVAFRELESIARPYHSQLMEPTARQLVDWLGEFNFKIGPLTAQFISSVDGKHYLPGRLFSKSEFVYLVSQQLVQPLFFVDQIQNIIELGIHSFLEIGLSGIYRDFLKDIACKNSKNNSSIQTLSTLLNSGTHKSKKIGQFRLDLEKSPAFKILSKYISNITGYDLIEIGIEDNFQEDLRIDSIKKAEIVFKTLQETNTQIDESLSLAKMRSVGEVVEFLEKMQLAPVHKKKRNAQRDISKLFIPLIQKYLPSPQYTENSPLISQKYLKLILNNDISQYSKQISEFYYNNEIDSKCLIFEIDQNMTMEESEYLEFFNQMQMITALLERNVTQLKIILLSEKESTLFHSLAAFFKSLSKEFGLTFKSIIHDLDSHADQQIWEIINYESHELFSIDVYYLKKQRLSLSWIPLKEDFKNKESTPFSRNKIVIIGGSKGLAFEIFSYLKNRTSIELVIWGRSSDDDKTIKTNLTFLKRLFKNVHYVQTDALIEREFTSALSESRRLLGSIDLVINSAGIEHSRLFTEKSITEIQQEASTKIIISQLLQKHNTNNKFDILHFSSIVGAFGNDGQSIYAYGNAYQSQLPNSLSIMWPGLNQVGMTKNLGILHKLKSSGINLLEIKDAATWFESLLHANFWGNTKAEKFNGSIAYLDPKDIFLMEFFTRNLDKLGATYGEMTSPADLLFRKIYNTQKDNYLIDHVIESISVVPASVAMVSMLSFGHLYYKNFPDLVDFEIKNIMMLIDGRDIESYSHFTTNLEKNNKSDFLKISTLITSQIEHFVGNMIPNIKDENNDSNRTTQEYNLQVDLSTFYSKECINFGPKFQTLSEIYYNDKISNRPVLGIGLTKPAYYTGIKVVDMLISVLESSFQTVSLYGLILGKGLVIPLRIARLQIIQLKFEKCFIVPEIIEANTNKDDLPLIAKVMVYNEKNEIVLIIDNLEMSAIRHHQSLPFKFNNLSRFI